MLVIHATVGSAESALNWLCNPVSKVSTHYLIDKSGRIYRLVSDDLSAWHAGKSRWRGLSATDIALGSIGIELENRNDGRDPYPPAQLDSLVELSHMLVVKYGILSDMVVRHLDIAIPPGRKTDPAGLDWEWYMSRLYVTQPQPCEVSTFRVRLDTQIGAVVRALPTKGSERMMSVPAGTILSGRVVTGELVILAGFEPSNQWLSLDNGGYVWLSLLETIPA